MSDERDSGNESERCNHPPVNTTLIFRGKASDNATQTPNHYDSYEYELHHFNSLTFSFCIYYTSNH